MSMLFAATYPERTRALVLCGAEVKEETDRRLAVGRNDPRGASTRSMDIDLIVERWGTGHSRIDHFAPSRAGDDAPPSACRPPTGRVREPARRRRLHADGLRDRRPPRRAGGQDADADRPPRGRQVCHVENARWLARHIAGARYVELPGDDHLPWVERRRHPRRDPGVPDRRARAGGAGPGSRDGAVHRHRRFDRTGARARRQRWRDLLDRHNEIVRRDLERFRGREVDTAGDGFFATFDGPARAIRCARSIVADVQSVGLEVRAGLHTGECELAGDQVRGIAVHTGARVASLAGAGEVLVSSTVRDLVAGSGIEFAERGVQSLKGIPGEWRLYAVA